MQIKSFISKFILEFLRFLGLDLKLRSIFANWYTKENQEKIDLKDFITQSLAWTSLTGFLESYFNIE